MMEISITETQGRATSMVMSAQTAEEEEILGALFRGLPSPPFEVHLFAERGRKSRPASLRMHWLDASVRRGESEKR